MNIIDAIKSGKRFRQNTGLKGFWLTCHEGNICYYVEDGFRIRHFYTEESFLADYEVEEKSVTITEGRLDKIIHDYKQIKAEPNFYLSFNDAIDYLKKELGFT